MTEQPTPQPAPVAQVLTTTRGEGSNHPAAHAQAIRDQIRNIRRPIDRSTRRST